MSLRSFRTAGRYAAACIFVHSHTCKHVLPCNGQTAFGAANTGSVKPPFLRGRIRVGLANGGVDKHVAEIDEAVLATPAIRVDDGAWEHSSANDPL